MRELIDPEFEAALLADLTGDEPPPPPPLGGTGDPLAGLEPGGAAERLGPLRHRLLRYLRGGILPTTFCVGCGGGTVLNAFAHAVDEMRLDPRRMVCVTGIGCASWIPSPYFLSDTLHTTHGRAIAFATGVKVMRPDLEVIVIAGDGDLAGIGGNHLIHAARRNVNLSVFLVNNFIYGMTGGQNAPTTPMTAKSSTMPFGNFERPFNIPHLAASCGATYVARWTCLHVRRLTKAFAEALGRKGFRFIEVIAPCSTLYARLNRLGSGLDLLRFYHDSAEVRHGADTRELDMGFQEKFICGKFVDSERPTFTEAMNEHYSKILGDRYVPMTPEGGWIHE